SFLESWPPLPFPGLGSLTFLTCRLVISIRKATKKAPTFIRCRNPEWLSVAGAFTSRTVASIATASRSAPITPPPISIVRETPLQVRPQNGVTAVARRAITFSIGQRCWVTCEWTLIWPTSATPPRSTQKPRHHTQAQRIRRILPHNHLLRRHLLRRPRKPPQLLRLLRHLRNPRRPTPLPGIINISMRPAV